MHNDGEFDVLSNLLFLLVSSNNYGGGLLSLKSYRLIEVSVHGNCV